MKAFNVVRFKVKPGKEKQFVDYHRDTIRPFAGFLGGSLVKTGDQRYCLVGEWKDLQSLIAARPQMIGVLDGMRNLLEELGDGLGVTDPVSGEVVAELAPASTARMPVKKAVKKSTKSSAKKAAKRAAPARKAKKPAKRSR